MLVSNNNLLKILLPSNNKVLNDALKQADVKTLSNIKNGEVTVEDILKNLFNQAKVGAKTNSSIETLLKNSTVFKDLGSFSKNIESLLKNPTNNETIQKFKPLLENFLKNLTNLDEKSLKSSLDKSGIFLESKMLAVAEAKTSLPKNLENLLNQIKTILKDIELPQAKNISQLIDKILSQNKKGQEANLSENVKDLKTLTQQLDTIGKSLQNKQTANLEQLTSNLKNISNQIQLTQSKIDNGSVNQIETLIYNKTENLAKTKDLLLNLKGEILQNNNIPNKQTLLTQIDNLLQSKEFTTKTTSTLNNNILPQDKQFSETISNLKNVLSSLQNRQIVSTERIENILQNLSSQIQTNPVKNEVQSQIKDLLLNLKNEILLDKNIPNKQAVLTQLDNLLQNKNLDSTSLKPLINNLSSNLDSLIKNLKTTIEQMNLGNTNQNSFEKINKTLVRLEQTIENFTQNLNRNEKPQNSSTTLQNDMKTVLLKMQEELVNNPDAKVAENSKQIDKIITQIEYHQLLSLVSNSNNVYIPFIWDILEDGSISMREGKDEKFYCEINLNLKEFGETRLLLGLYDKNKLDLTVYASKEHFKKAIQENIYKLKRALNSVELIPVNIHILNFENEKKEEVKKTDIYTQNSDNLGFGIDIKV